MQIYINICPSLPFTYGWILGSSSSEILFCPTLVVQPGTGMKWGFHCPTTLLFFGLRPSLPFSYGWILGSSSSKILFCPTLVRLTRHRLSGVSIAPEPSLFWRCVLPFHSAMVGSWDPPLAKYSSVRRWSDRPGTGDSGISPVSPFHYNIYNLLDKHNRVHPLLW